VEHGSAPRCQQACDVLHNEAFCLCLGDDAKKIVDEETAIVVPVPMRSWLWNLRFALHTRSAIRGVVAIFAPEGGFRKRLTWRPADNDQRNLGRARLLASLTPVQSLHVGFENGTAVAVCVQAKRLAGNPINFHVKPDIAARCGRGNAKPTRSREQVDYCYASFHQHLSSARAASADAPDSAVYGAIRTEESVSSTGVGVPEGCPLRVAEQRLRARAVGLRARRRAPRSLGVRSRVKRSGER